MSKLKGKIAIVTGGVMSINVKAPFFVSQHALPGLNNGGRMIKISSFVTRAASPSVFAYSMPKGAMNILRKGK
ncbi:SDR family NAD(P)-dependent oxidoreductase [Paenibacillus thiaminolyticus]|uniref:SDR family NAD(P)-dependent oxidoreductase n=1 Tax=Paenibacillus thiaminolyticus TaxID=49283 RepID=A0A3A3GER4_PANTH|nr:SDR family NAD(P)-dependent oxidoreductase [Paenibacillus thiaminolyticus]